MLKMKGLESSSDNLSTSWRDILLNLSEDDEENDIMNICSQPILFNYNTEIVVFLLLKLLL